MRIIDWEGVRYKTWSDTERIFNEEAASEMCCMEDMLEEFPVTSSPIDAGGKTSGRGMNVERK